MKIAIASGKGGTGKTSLAVNLAMLAAEKHMVVLADMDVEEPDAGLFIKTEDVITETREKMIPECDAGKCSLCGICQEVCNFNAIIRLGNEILVFPELCHSCHACVSLCPESALAMKGRKMGEMKRGRAGNLVFIENRLDIGQEQAVPLISQGLEFLEKNFTPDNLIIIDSPPGTTCPVIEVAAEADLVILVAEPTPFGLHDLKLAVETMELLKREYAVVINRFGIGDDRLEQYCMERDIPVIARIPDSRRAAELCSSGSLIYPEIPEIRDEVLKVYDYITSKKKVPAK